MATQALVPLAVDCPVVACSEARPAEGATVEDPLADVKEVECEEQARQVVVTRASAANAAEARLAVAWTASASREGAPKEEARAAAGAEAAPLEEADYSAVGWEGHAAE